MPVALMIVNEGSLTGAGSSRMLSYSPLAAAVSPAAPTTLTKYRRWPRCLPLETLSLHASNGITDEMGELTPPQRSETTHLIKFGVSFPKTPRSHSSTILPSHVIRDFGVGKSDRVR